MKRRHFLQFAGSSLGAIALHQAHFLHQGDRYGRVLAQETPRKLALLVGINNYPDEIGALNGCLTDVELQKHLLIHRFGFNPSDVMEVSDNVTTKPTRDNILTAFEEHLIKQAKPGDVVVFHFSGHGSRIRDPYPLDIAQCREVGDCELNGTIVPIDAVAERNGSEIAVPDIMGQTLFLLTEQINTDFLTIVLDSCHSGAGTRGNVRVRSARVRSGVSDVLVPAAAELQFQEELRSRNNLSLSAFQAERQRGIAKGVALGSAQRDQEAIDGYFEGFHAGVFTYLLTRYLWQVTGTQAARTVYFNLDRSTKSLAYSQSERIQVPIFEYEPDQNYQQQPFYFSDLTTPPAEAVLISVEPIQFWLGGVSSQNLRSASGSEFTVINDTGEAIATIQQTGRVGLVGEGELTEGDPNTLREGLLLRERVVGISANPTLKVGVDASLGEDIESVTTDLATVSRVEVVEAQVADCLIGRFTEEYQQRLSQAGTTEMPSVGSVGLFAPDLTPIFGSFGLVREPAIAAINRLRSRFKQILARQLLGQLLTAGTGSPLRVEARVFAADGTGDTLQVMSRGAQETQSMPTTETTIPQFRTGASLQVEVKNLEPDQDLYLSILVIGAGGEMNVVYPAEWNSPDQAARIFKGDRLVMPRPEDQTDFAIEGVGGFPELLILVSKEPLRQALSVMQSIARGRNQSRGALTELRGDEPLDILDQLIGDLDSFSRSGRQPQTGTVTARSTTAYDTSTLAVLSAIFEVVE